MTEKEIENRETRKKIEILIKIVGNIQTDREKDEIIPLV